MTKKNSSTNESRVVAELYEGDVFGERALFAEEGEVRGASVLAKTDVECLALEREDFLRVTSGMETFMPGCVCLIYLLSVSLCLHYISTYAI